MHHADLDAHADLERQAALARRCFTWNEDELRASAKRHAGLPMALGFAAGFLIVLVCVLGYALFRVFAG